MRILGLDLSTHIGWSVMNNDILEYYGLYDAPNFSGRSMDHSLLAERARYAMTHVGNLLWKYKPDYIVIEETNLGKQRLAQKQLEWIHFTVFDLIEKANLSNKVIYIDTSAWRKMLSLKLSKEQREHNKNVKKSKTRSKSGEGKVTWKHLSVNYVNDRFGLKFKFKDNDITDAICLACSGLVFIKEINTQSPSVKIIDSWKK